MRHVLIAGVVAGFLMLVGSCGGGGSIDNGLSQPDITAVTPLTAIAGAAVTFSATNAGGAATSWAWNFSGGATPGTSSTSSPAVTAGAVGSYSCTVTATNLAGSDTFSFTFSVSPPGNTQTLGPQGGTVDLGPVDVTAPDDVLIGDVQFQHTLAAVPAGAPAEFVPNGMAHEISVDHAERFNAPVILTFDYDDSGITDESSMAVLHYTPAGGYEPTTTQSIDTAANRITINTRTFSFFIVGLVELATHVYPATYETGFTPGNNGWQINNFGNYFSSGGNCLGMSAYATWFYSARSGTNLFGHYSSAGAPSIAELTITRAHLAQSQTWAVAQHTYEQTIGAALTGQFMRYYLHKFQKPLVLLMFSASAAHACVVHGWDNSGFTFYDVNLNGADQHVNWSTLGGFGIYSSYNKFSFIAMPSLGRTEDFEALTQQAESGFSVSNTISVSKPQPNEQISHRQTELAGSLAGGINPAMEVLCYVKGVQQQVALANGSFASTIPVANGDNTIALVAGVNVASQSNWYLNAATYIFNIKGDIPKTDLLATLAWDQGLTDVDLYVAEPSAQTVWYQNMLTTNGLELDFDNTVGFGPEHATLASASGGKILSGEYVISVHYYWDHDEPQAVSGNVTIVLYEGEPDQQMVNVPFALGVDNADNDAPGSSGPDWVDIASVDVENGVIDLF